MKGALRCAVLCALLATSLADSFLCEGTWVVDKIEYCEDRDKYPIKSEITKRKLDRHTDGFSAEIELPEDFTSDYMLNLESYEKCDGGYKQSDSVTGAACEMLEKFANQTFQDMFTLWGLEQRSCPVPKGKYTLKDYKFNYDDLPRQGKCSTGMFKIIMLKGIQEMSCLKMFTTLKVDEDNDDDDDDE